MRSTASRESSSPGQSTPAPSAAQKQPNVGEEQSDGELDRVLGHARQGAACGHARDEHDD